MEKEKKKIPVEGDTKKKSKESKKTPRSKKKSSSSQSKLRKELEQKVQEVSELKDKYLRLMAEFDNYRKRTTKEKLSFMQTASKDLIESLLPVLDDFDRAKKSADDVNSEETFSDGVSLVYEKIYNTLKGKGLTEMETIDKAFDPEFHEAITEIPAPNKSSKGKIVDTIEKGYLLNGTIIRHAKVVVGK